MLFGDDAEEFAHLHVADLIATKGDGLFEKRKGIAQAAFRGASEHRDRARIDLEILGFGDPLKRFGNFAERERAELKQLCARFDRIGEIFRPGSSPG